MITIIISLIILAMIALLVTYRLLMQPIRLSVFPNAHTECKGMLAEIPVNYCTFESACGKLRVDFGENDKDFLSQIKVGSGSIYYHGTIFKFAENYQLVNGLRIDY